jgi:4-hydroxybenzoate polyprenyltransferase
MPTASPRWLAFAQLLRLPNVFTAIADIAMAGCATGAIIRDSGTVLLLMAASACLYLAGMVFNDLFDRADDARSRPFRPIPSGRVLLRTAIIIAITLSLLGITLAAITPGLFVAVLLFVLILLYDGMAKHHLAGTVVMGACRSLNILLGLATDFEAIPNPLQWHLCLTTGTYIAGVTLFARTEESASRPVWLMIAAAVMLAGLVLALTVPIHLPPGHVGPSFIYLVTGFGIYLAMRIIPAIAEPTPSNVQAAVKRSILGLIFLDAILATAFVGLHGLWIVMLLVPARILGRRVYST